MISRLFWLYPGQLYQYNRSSAILQAFHRIHHPRFMYYVMREKGQVYHALKHFFKKQEAAG